MIATVASRAEVLQHLEPFLKANLDGFLKKVDESWQPSDYIPDSRSETFFDEVKSLREAAQGLSYDLLAVLIGDTITEEALPNYEAWFHQLDDMNKDPDNGWAQWIRGWTAEENRHGDLLNRYLYLSGRVNMREFEVSTQYLISDGFDLGTAHDPYRAFVYTSYQEAATNLSHRRVGTLARKAGDAQLSKICGMIAGDEARHARVYQTFVEKIFEVDPSEMMLAFEDMMRKKIVMPAHYMREMGVEMGKTFGHFTDAAQRLGVYTSQDYTDILESLITTWKLDQVTDLNDAAEKARDYIMALPNRLRRVADRMPVPKLEYKFKWIE
ncbi:acyl-[acyl-carrier-protein] desaturase [Hymenobacter daecheongensis DSM 21074]|uniref:Acyl-[acyl-carrier-protein] desaturase n=1 Tax=Hymenobacter daecheongensis DSM 21074 TaxID=1121955 RepID=A0A1M6E798_9BACT|nr:acyl-ACP desaturase [Hymenobacter daecheongensis]SHI81249.1 acyl-[acyl-carrier-protein] desaturase [Hymenobacter daecheongensis DSM 21074]